MRNKYSKEFERDMYNLAKDNTLDMLLDIAKTKYHYDITKEQLREYLSKRHIRYKGYNPLLATCSDKLPIGSERIKSDKMVQVKVAKDKWEYKQRLIYEQYYNVKLSSDDYIIFLDHDRTNFDINNLKRVSRRESSIMANFDLFFTKQEMTNVGVDIAKLAIKIKDKRA